MGSQQPVAAAVVSFEGSKVDDAADHVPSGVAEFDRVLGGGLVRGSAILVGGEPGVGKSTLLMQVAAALGGRGGRVLLATAEESTSQVMIRARRLGIDGAGMAAVAEHRVEAIIAAADDHRPDLLVVDSIQTVVAETVNGPAGSVGQVREGAAILVRFAKEAGVPLVLVGHVTKDGSIGGPKLLEHMVDVVLYMEGDPRLGIRLLRSLKNRFGATNEVGLFEMGDGGLRAVADPSRSLVGDWRGSVPGTVVFPAVEGRRPLLVEIQALVAASPTPQPRRSARGIELARLHQLLAVLERHVGLSFSGREVYVSAVGGVRVNEPAADLAMALALASSLTGRAVGHLAAWGEIGLTGEVRPTSHDDWRRAEALRLGVSAVLAPRKGAHEAVGAVLAGAGVLESAPRIQGVAV